MKITEELFIQHVGRRVSGSGNVYYIIDLVEKMKVEDENGNPITRQWNNIYYMPNEGSLDPIPLKASNAKVTITFYPIERKVGENVYQDIRASIINIVAA